jgi:predicted dehydrogenase
VKFLVCGVGSVGERHIRNLLELGYKDILLYRRSDLPLRTIKDTFATYTSIDKALLEKPDVALITNPTSLHMPVALRCAEAGCHLFMEKPISNNLEGTSKLKSIVNEKNLTVFVGFQFRFHPGIIKIKQLLNERTIGDVVCVHAHWGEYLPDWHPWEDYQNSYSAREDLGGGVILTLCHPIDYVQWLFGEITSVSAIAGSLSGLSVSVEDVADVLLQFKSNIIGYIHLDYVQRPKSHWLQITGCKGRIKWDNDDGIVRLYKADSECREDFPLPDGFERNTMFVNEMQHFIGCVQDREKLLVDLSDGIKTVKVVLATKQSISERRMVFIASDN